MNVLKKCCYRSLKENPKRTIVTIIGIILATALITGVSCMAVSFRKSMIAYEIMQNGDYHYRFSEVLPENLKYFQNNQQIKNIVLMENLGYARLEGSQNPDKPYLYVTGIDETAEEALSLQLIEGRMPENDSEIVIANHIRVNGRVDLKIGDVITVSLGNRMSEGYRLNQKTYYLYDEETIEDTVEKTYTIVGIMERPGRSVEPVSAPGYSVFTRIGDPNKAEMLDVFASYTKQGLKHRDQVTAGILGISEDLFSRYYGGLDFCTEEEIAQAKKVAQDVTENYWLIKWELLFFASDTMNMLYSLAAMAVFVIIVTSVFCIHNSFVISLTEKTKLYGRLSSVGTTSRQQKKIVYYEAVFLGAAGIPLGVVSGVGATAILVKVVGSLVDEAMGFSLLFGVSLPAILLSAVLAAVTVFLSASRSAGRAGKLSPISAIRANDTVRIRKRELRCPRILERLFGIGGKIAYRNLKRARVKYRTTVISIVVSVAVFIGMSTFVDILFDISGYYNSRLPYQIKVGTEDYEDALVIAALEGVKEAEVVRGGILAVDMDRMPYTEKYLAKHSLPKEEGVQEHIYIRSLGKEAYERYCRNVGVSVEEAKDKAIIAADYYEQGRQNGKQYYEEYKIAEFKEGDIIRGIWWPQEDGEEVEIQVLTQTEKMPMFLQDADYNAVLIIVSDEWMDKQSSSALGDTIEVYMICEDSDRLEEAVRNKMELKNYILTNHDAVFRADRSLHLVIAIFLYGFITVVALIGITNIFNTITTNMELRAPEFAMVKSVGMTGQEFRHMIWLEGMFYGIKALVIGIPAGVVLSYGFHTAMNEGLVADFRFPWKGILLSGAAVAVLLFGIMHYSMSKINKKNMIETIQNENI